MWRLQVEPTIATAGLVVEHGDWTIEVRNIPENAEFHAYVARTDPNMNVRTGAKRSYFVDAKWEKARSAEAKCKYDNGEFDKSGSLVDRYGTLNGIATAKDHDGVHVAGGYIICESTQVAHIRRLALLARVPLPEGTVPIFCCPVTSPTRCEAYAPEATGMAPLFA